MSTDIIKTTIGLVQLREHVYSIVISYKLEHKTTLAKKKSYNQTFLGKVIKFTRSP